MKSKTICELRDTFTLIPGKEIMFLCLQTQLLLMLLVVLLRSVSCQITISCMYVIVINFSPQ